MQGAIPIDNCPAADQDGYVVLRFCLQKTGAHMAPQAPSVFELSRAEKLRLVEDLWDALAASPDDVPVHEWQKEDLARRKANLQKNPASGLGWDEIKRRVRSRHGR